MRTRRRRKSEQLSRWDRERAINSWWAEKCQKPFLSAAQSWQLGQSVRIAEESGQNVEYASGESSMGTEEIKLKDAIRTTRGRPISSVDIAMKFRAEARSIQNRLGAQSEWVLAFLNWTVSLIAEELQLSQKMQQRIRTYINQPLLPNF